VNELVTALMLILFAGACGLVVLAWEAAVPVVRRALARSAAAQAAETTRRADEAVALAASRRAHPSNRVRYDLEPSLETALNEILGRTAPRP